MSGAAARERAHRRADLEQRRRRLGLDLLVGERGTLPARAAAERACARGACARRPRPRRQRSPAGCASGVATTSLQLLSSNATTASASARGRAAAATSATASVRASSLPLAASLTRSTRPSPLSAHADRDASRARWPRTSRTARRRRLAHAARLDAERSELDLQCLPQCVRARSASARNRPCRPSPPAARKLVRARTQDSASTREPRHTRLNATRGRAARGSIHGACAH